jgi:5-methylcytosine-specific restriction endonuclease McrA
MPNCLQCGSPFSPNRQGPPRKYCTQQCSSRAYHLRRMDEGRSLNRTMHERVCVVCGGKWMTPKAKATHCSPACIAAARFGPERHPRRAPYSERMIAARGRQRRASRGTTGKGTVWTEGPCRRCGTRFLSKTSALTSATYCGRRCKQGDIGDRRRARIKHNFVDVVRRSRVFERDGYRCHICGQKTDRTKCVPHPRAPTIDHLIPIALGGEHSHVNVATAHFLCNATKSSTGAGDQLALLG